MVVDRSMYVMAVTLLSIEELERAGLVVGHKFEMDVAGLEDIRRCGEGQGYVEPTLGEMKVCLGAIQEY